VTFVASLTGGAEVVLIFGPGRLAGVFVGVGLVAGLFVVAVGGGFVAG
jgi:hypothetical protein